MVTRAQRLRWALGDVSFGVFALSFGLAPLSFGFFGLFVRTRTAAANPSLCAEGTLANHGRIVCVSAGEHLLAVAFIPAFLVCVVSLGLGKLLLQDRADERLALRVLGALAVAAFIANVLFGQHIAYQLTTGSLTLPPQVSP